MSRRWLRALPVVVLLLAGIACGGQAPGAPSTKGKAPDSGPVAGDVQQGRKLFTEKGCGACHVVRGVPEAFGTIGPNLSDMGTKQRIAETMPNTPENMKRWLMNPPATKPGTAMPQLGVTEKEAEDLTAYLATLR